MFVVHAEWKILFKKYNNNGTTVSTLLDTYQSRDLLFTTYLGKKMILTITWFVAI